MRLKSEFLGNFKKFYFLPLLLYLMLFYVLYGLVLFRKGDFHSVKCL